MADITHPAGATPPGSPAPQSRRIPRPDLVQDGGRFAIVNTTLSPREAMVEDLLFVGATLDAAGIDFLLVRGNDRRPVVAVDSNARDALRAVLERACADEPFYAKAADGPHASPALISDGALRADPRVRAFTLFRRRVTPTGSLRYGSKEGVRLELWDYDADSIVAPAENSLMREVLPRREAALETVERHGRAWTTLAGMFLPQAGDVRFDIDLVFSWVDGASLEWQRARARRMQSYVVGEGDDSQARFRQLDELKYALRSVHLYAPWIRKIFVVTDSPSPAWLAEHPQVRLVRSEEIFVDPTHLPTHNSHAVESRLHHIEGLSEHFLYSNDDMFMGRAVTPDLFFSPGGVGKFIEATTRIGLGENGSERSGFENAARVNRALLRDRFGAVITRHLEHTPVPLRISVLRELEREFPADFARTAASAFRSATDISVTNSLYHYYALLTGRSVLQTSAKVRYVDTTMRQGIVDMRSLLERRNIDLFCLNDGSFPELSTEERSLAVRSFLEAYFPLPAPWETVESVEAAGGGYLASSTEPSAMAMPKRGQ